MRYKLDQFELHVPTNEASQDAAMLQTKTIYGQIAPGVPGIFVEDELGRQLSYLLHKVDTDASGEDVYGWHFRVTTGSRIINANCPSKIFIVND